MIGISNREYYWDTTCPKKVEKDNWKCDLCPYNKYCTSNKSHISDLAYVIDEMEVVK